MAVLDDGVDADDPDLDGRLADGSDVGDGNGSGTHAARFVALAAPDVLILPFDVLDDDGRADPADVAVAVSDAVDEGASIIALTLGGDPEALAAALSAEIVQRTIRAANESGALVVAPDPGLEVELPDDLAIVLVGDRAASRPLVSGGDVDTVAATALVAGTASLVAGLVPVHEIGPLLVNSAQGPDRTVDAAAAVSLSSNVGAGGRQLPPPEDLEGGLSPGTIGAIVFGAALAAVGGMIWIGTRRPRPRTGG